MMPGQELREFVVSKPETRSTENRRAGLFNQYVKVGTIWAILAQAKPEETQRWRQLNHPVSHKIIMQHKPTFEVGTGYIFEQSDTSQKFYVSAVPYEPGGIGHWMIFYCTDRRDVNN